MRSRSSSPMPSVLLTSGMSSTSMTTTTASSHPIAASQTTGPQPRSLQRKRSPRSSRRLPVPHRPVANQHHHTRRPVADDDGDRGVRGDRPLEAQERVEQERGWRGATRRARRRRPAATSERQGTRGPGRRGDEHRRGVVRPATGRRSSAPAACRAGSRYQPAGGPLGGGNVAMSDRSSTTRSVSTCCPLPALTRSQRTGDAVCEDRPMRAATAPSRLAVGGDDARPTTSSAATPLDGRHSTSTWPSSAPGTPACGRRYYLAAADPAAAHRRPRARARRLRRQRPQRRLVLGAAGHELARARRRPRPGRGDRHAAGDAGHRRRGRPRRRRRRARTSSRAGTISLARTRRPARPPGRGRRGGPALRVRRGRPPLAHRRPRSTRTCRAQRHARRAVHAALRARCTRCAWPTPSPGPASTAACGCTTARAVVDVAPHRVTTTARSRARRCRRGRHRGVHRRPPRAPPRPAADLLADGGVRAARRAAQWDEIGLAGRPTFHDARHSIVYGQRTADGRIAFGGRGAPYHFGSRVEPAFDTDERVRAMLVASVRELFPVLADVDFPFHWGGPLGVPRDWRCAVRFDGPRGSPSPAATSATACRRRTWPGGRWPT